MNVSKTQQVMNATISIVFKSFEIPKLQNIDANKNHSKNDAPYQLLGQRTEPSPSGEKYIETLALHNNAEKRNNKCFDPQAGNQQPGFVQYKTLPVDANTSVRKAGEHFFRERDPLLRRVFKRHKLRSIRLPKTRTLFTVLRSPHIDKKSREQFEMRIHKQLIVINSETRLLRTQLLRLKLHEIPGVQFKIIVNYKTRFN